MRYPSSMVGSTDLTNAHGITGLCADCLHARRIESPRGSVFYLCELSLSDPRFPKYPRLPVVSCSGYEKRGEQPPGANSR
jgi:hypothetical protein